MFYNVSFYCNQSAFLELYEALHLRDDQYQFDLNLLPHGTCFQQSVFAGQCSLLAIEMLMYSKEEIIGEIIHVNF